jgi:hypothetical protein
MGVWERLWLVMLLRHRMTMNHDAVWVARVLAVLEYYTRFVAFASGMSYEY